MLPSIYLQTFEIFGSFFSGAFRIANSLSKFVDKQSTFFDAAPKQGIIHRLRLRIVGTAATINLGMLCWSRHAEENFRDDVLVSKSSKYLCRLGNTLWWPTSSQQALFDPVPALFRAIPDVTWLDYHFAHRLITAKWTIATAILRDSVRFFEMRHRVPHLKRASTAYL